MIDGRVGLVGCGPQGNSPAHSNQFKNWLNDCCSIGGWASQRRRKNFSFLFDEERVRPGCFLFFHQTKQINSLQSIQSKKFDFVEVDFELLNWRSAAPPTNHKTNKSNGVEFDLWLFCWCCWWIWLNEIVEFDLWGRSCRTNSIQTINCFHCVGCLRRL